LASGQMFEPISTEINPAGTVETVSISLQGDGSNGASVQALETLRELVIPAKAVLLNLLSVGAAYGLLVLVFQHSWAEGILGFHSNGAITSWLPLFMFVILFGLSMDYHVFILSRVKELYDAGMSTED